MFKRWASTNVREGESAMTSATRASVLLALCNTWAAPAAFAHTEVTDTRIVLHSGDFAPRFAALTSNRLVVPEGETVELPEESEFEAIEVAGTLRVSRNHDTVCRFVNLQILPGGHLDMGTEQDPVYRRVLFIVRDRPLDVENDPYQWGHGIFNLGLWTVYGRPVERTWSQCQPAAAGADRLEPVDKVQWQVGDTLLVPDTRQIRWGGWHPAGQVVPIRRESPVAVRGIQPRGDGAGVELLLTKPLDFEHLEAKSPQGEMRFLPYVANATRNIVICSENPAGVRGHTVTTGDGAQSLAFAAFVDLGRTMPAPLDSTTVADGVVHVGTNQVGRYPVHWHHAHTSAPDWGLARGLYVDGSDITKWGIVVHGTDDVVVEHCVVNRCVGAGIITEDGPEVRNVFERNFVMGCLGQTEYEYFPLDAKFQNLAGIPGGEGSGFWFHGTMNTVRGNVACNNIVGINAFLFRPLTYNHSSLPGGPKNTPFNRFRAVPVDFRGNVAFSNAINGFEAWNLPEDGSWVAHETDCWHNGSNQVAVGSGERGSVSFDRLRTLAADGVGVGIHSSAAYTFVIKLTNSRLEGSDTGLLTAQARYEVVNTTLHNKLNIDWRLNNDGSWSGPSRGVLVKNCKAEPLVEGEPNILASFLSPEDVELNGTGYPGDKPPRPNFRPRYRPPIPNR